jgi:predicted Zn finger-like uncharacterized protein
MRRLACPHCGFSKEVAATSIPPGVSRLKCPKCQQAFPLPTATASAGPAEKPHPTANRPPGAPEPAAGTADQGQAERSDQVSITCPHCGDQREVERAKIPPRLAKVLCKKCQKDFTIRGDQLSGFAHPGSQIKPPPVAPAASVSPARSVDRPSRRRLMSLGELFYRSWETFKRRILTLIGINLLAAVLAVIVYFLLGSGVELLQQIAGDNLVVMLLVGLVMVGFSLLVVTAIGAAMTYAIIDEELGVRQALGYGIQNFLPFLWVFSLVGFILVGGYLAFFLPGLLFTVWFIFAQFLLARDDARGMDALLLSRAYVRGHGWGVCGRILLLGVLGGLVSAIPLIGLLFGLVLGPFTLIFYHEIFRDLLEIKGNITYSGSRGAKAKWLLAGTAGYLVVPLSGLLLLGPTLFQGLDLLRQRGGAATVLAPVVAPAPAVTLTPNWSAGPAEQGQLSLNQTVFAPQEAISVEFSSPEGLAADAWVGIIPSHVPHGDESRNDQYDLSYQYLNNLSHGSLQFSAPDQPGSYDLRMHDTDNNGREIASVSFQVSGSEGTPVTKEVIPEQSPTSIYVPQSGNNPDQVMVYVFAINYLGSVRLNGREIYPVAGERDMSYNFTSNVSLERGSNTFELDYRALPDPWMTRIQLKVSRYDWNSGQETVFGDWTFDDAGSKRQVEVVLGN